MKGDGFLDRIRSSHVGAAGTCGRGMHHVRRIDTDPLAHCAKEYGGR